MVWGWYVTEDYIQRVQAENERIATYSRQADALITQELADEWAIVAQKYAGYFYGHPTRAGQFGKPDAGKLYIDYEAEWEDPIVFPDDCEFCQVLTEDRIESRIRGFQESIDIEVRGRQAPEALYMTDLPFYLKKRLCIEWNHLLRDFLADRPFLEYDLEARELRIKVVPRDGDEATGEPATEVLAPHSG